MANTKQAKTVGMADVRFDKKKKKIAKKKAQPVHVTCQAVPVPSLSGRFFFEYPSQLFPGAHLACV